MMIIMCLIAAAILLAALVLSLTQTMTVTWSDSSLSQATTYTLTGDGGVNLEVACPDAATTESDVAIVRAKIHSLMIVCDQTVTLKTNSSGAPDDTVALTAGVAKYFVPSNPFFGTNFFGTADITKIFVVNASGTAATFTLRCLVDTTP